MMKKLYIQLNICLIFILFPQTLNCQTVKNIITVSDDIELIKISDNAYIHVSYVYMEQYGRMGANGLIYTQGNKAFLFDTPWKKEQTKTLCEFLTDSLNLNIEGFVPNHWHWDCMGGLEYLQEQHIKSYAHQITIDSARAKGLPVPEISFTDSLDLTLGSTPIKCYYFGAAHSTDNIVVYIPTEKILFPGCMVKCINCQNLGFTGDGDEYVYPTTIDKLINKFPDIQIVIPGHADYGGKELLSHTLKLAARAKKD